MLARARLRIYGFIHCISARSEENSRFCLTSGANVKRRSEVFLVTREMLASYAFLRLRLRSRNVLGSRPTASVCRLCMSVRFDFDESSFTAHSKTSKVHYDAIVFCSFVLLSKLWFWPEMVGSNYGTLLRSDSSYKNHFIIAQRKKKDTRTIRPRWLGFLIHAPYQFVQSLIVNIIANPESFTSYDETLKKFFLTGTEIANTENLFFFLFVTCYRKEPPRNLNR